MKSTLILIFTLLLPVIGMTQEAGLAAVVPADTNLKKIVQLAALQPDTEEFDDAWSAYVRDHHDGMDMAATIDIVVKESSEFLRQINVPGRGSTKRSMSNSELREKMQALADAALEDDRR